MSIKVSRPICRSSELKAQVSFSDRFCLPVCLSVRLSVSISYFRHLLKNHWANFTKLGTKHAWVRVKRIQVCSNEVPFHFPRVDNCKILKLLWLLLKIFFSRTARPISTKLGTIHPGVKGIKVWSNWLRPIPRGDNYEIA